jgi:hypothetical protein
MTNEEKLQALDAATMQAIEGLAGGNLLEKKAEAIDVVKQAALNNANAQHILKALNIVWTAEKKHLYVKSEMKRLQASYGYGMSVPHGK